MAKAMRRLGKELKSVREYNEFSVDADDIFNWKVIIYGPIDTPYEGGIFKARMEFSRDYPTRAPKFRFESKITHPNIYVDGKVCISILHEGEDRYGYESLSERWSPSQGVASVILSIISMLSDPNFESPANTDASVMWQRDYDSIKRIIYKEVALSQR